VRCYIEPLGELIEQVHPATATPSVSRFPRGQLVRALASDAIRASLERHFGVRLAFQNCHRVAAFRLDADPAAHAEFTSARSQVLNQSPLLRNC